MDSVTQKQNYLSLTGIDQMSENTDNIETLQGQMQTINDKLATLDGQVISLNNEDQLINGHKSFVHGITSTSVGCFYDATTDRVSNIELYSPDLQALSKPNYTLKFNARQGTIITGQITLDSEVLTINNTKGLQTQLTNILNALTKINNVLNVTIPFQPSIQDTITNVLFNAPNSISFYAGSTYVIAGFGNAATPNIMRCYRHPTSFYITHVGAMYDQDAITTVYTTTIRFELFSSDGATSKGAVPEAATFPVGLATLVGMYKFTTPIFVADTNSLKGSHLYSRESTTANPFKECYYVIYGYQV